MSRPGVDVVVPFAGPAEELAATVERLRELRLGPDDTVTIVDNNPRPLGVPSTLHAGERRTPGYARNRGVERGANPWLLFLDADVRPEPNLLERMFDPPPEERTALLAGRIEDEFAPVEGPPAARYAYVRKLLSQDSTFKERGDFAFPNTANTACRRAPFEAIGGFREDIRAGEDGDLAYRLRDAGWGVELRDDAVGVHQSRRTTISLLRQLVIHGAGAGWLHREYPGAFPRRKRPGLTWWGIKEMARGLTAAARARDRDKAIWFFYEPLHLVVWEWARSLPNERPLPRQPWTWFHR
jgi:glycosyltransferase involved in cell wall biosynthesis